MDNQYFDFNKDIKQVIRKNIRKYRKIRGYTQEQLALMAEISYDFMRRIETGHGFSIQTLYKLAVCLDVSVDELMEIKKDINLTSV